MFLLSYDLPWTLTDSVIIRTQVSPPAEADTTKPVITLTGGTTSMTVGGIYTAPTVKVIDNIDGDITSSVVKTGSVDTGTAGTYTIKYTASDKAGNKAEKIHTVVVSDAANTAPTWTQDSYDTGLLIEDDNDGIKTIMNLKAPASSDAEGDTITYSIVSISVPNSADQEDWDNASYIDNGVLKVRNLVSNDPNHDGTVTITIKATATGGSNNTTISFEFEDFQ